MNYTRFLNAVSLARKPSPIRALTALLMQSPPSTISLAGGMPNANLFPFESAEIKLRDGSKLVLDENKMKVALQYGATPGLSSSKHMDYEQADLVKWLMDMQASLHRPPTLGALSEDQRLDLVITPGCQDGICKSFEAMIEPGDNVIIDCPTYAGTLAILSPLGCNMLPVETDSHGMKPSSLREVLSRWKPSDAKDPSARVPKMMYTIPNGVNPTGSSLTEDRKREIYQIAREYDMLIFEDDPYYFLQYTDTPAPSFLQLDEDGRVLRFDSFSKVLSSGLRVGFATGPHVLIDRIVMHMQVSSMHTTALSQVLVYELLNKWGPEGFKNHINSVKEFYRKQRDATMESSKRWLTGLAEWNEPQAGMFVWYKLNGINDTKKLINEKALAKEVMLVPGCAFMPDSDAPCPYVRAAFSVTTPENIDKGLERLASLIKDELKTQ